MIYSGWTMAETIFLLQCDTRVTAGYLFMMSVGWRLLLLINKSCIQNTDNMYCRVVENCIMSFRQHRLSVFGIKAYHKWVYLILCCLIVALDVSCDSVRYLVWRLNVVLYLYVGQVFINVGQWSIFILYFGSKMDNFQYAHVMYLAICERPLYLLIVDRIPCTSCRQGLKLTVISSVNMMLNVLLLSVF